nr:MAG TPA: hypothetical protein [Caudoviricetes sp.]
MAITAPRRQDDSGRRVTTTHTFQYPAKGFYTTGG